MVFRKKSGMLFVSGSLVVHSLDWVRMVFIQWKRKRPGLETRPARRAFWKTRRFRVDVPLEFTLSFRKSVRTRFCPENNRVYPILSFSLITFVVDTYFRAIFMHWLAPSIITREGRIQHDETDRRAEATSSDGPGMSYIATCCSSFIIRSSALATSWRVQHGSYAVKHVM